MRLEVVGSASTARLVLNAVNDARRTSRAWFGRQGRTQGEHDMDRRWIRLLIFVLTMGFVFPHVLHEFGSEREHASIETSDNKKSAA